MKIALIAVCICCIFLQGCGSISGADKFTEEFIEKYKNSDYQGMYDMFDDAAKRTGSFSDFKLFYEKAHEKTGDIQSYKKVNWSFVTYPQGVAITLTYDATCSKYKAKYIIVVHKTNKFTIWGFHIDSEAFRESFLK